MITMMKRLQTIADYQALPEGPPYFQLIDGELVMDGSPSLSHQQILFTLTLLLGNHVRAHRLGRVYFAPLDVYFSEYNLFQPDLLFVSHERASLMAENGMHGAPDLTVEILSPSTQRRDRVQKLRVYRDAGVKEFWLIDPSAGGLHRYDFAHDPATPARVISGSESFTSPLFPGLTIVAAEIFER